jgi:hypothetical protein
VRVLFDPSMLRVCPWDASFCASSSPSVCSGRFFFMSTLWSECPELGGYFFYLLLHLQLLLASVVDADVSNNKIIIIST